MKRKEIVTGDRAADALVILDAIEERSFKGRGPEFEAMRAALVADVCKFVNAARSKSKRVSMRRWWHRRGIEWIHAWHAESNLVCLICRESVVSYGRNATQVTQAIMDRVDVHVAACCARWLLDRSDAA